MMATEGDSPQSATSDYDSAAAAWSDELSPEDAAWVDSCLVKDHHEDDDDDDDSWGVLADALLAALSSSATTVHDGPSTAQAGFPAADSDESSSLSSAALYGELPPTLSRSQSADPYDGGPSAEQNDYERVQGGGGGEEAEASPVRGKETYLMYDYNPEEEEKVGYGDHETDAEASAVSPAAPAEERDIESTENIFKVWDLNLPDEEGELSSQLKKALEGSSPLPPVLDDQNLDDELIIACIEDLSLLAISD